MKRLAVDVVSTAPERMNGFGERELRLRGLGAPQIENLGCTNDQFQTIDLCHNQILVLGGFPLLKRLRTLLLSSNVISSVADNIGKSLPFLEELVLMDNRIASLLEIERLASLTKLKALTLVGNPVTSKPFYRMFCIRRIPSLQVLDFQKVRLVEKREASRFFSSGAGKLFEETVKQHVDAAAPVTTTTTSAASMASSQSELEKRKLIKDAILAATSLEEIEQLESQLSIGNLQFAAVTVSVKRARIEEEQEEKQVETS